MALFTRNGRPTRARPPAQRRVIIIQEPAPTQVPAFLKNLRLLCHGAAHPLPVQMTCIGQNVSDAGQPMAIYACPFQGCRHREGWVQNRDTGRPFRLWAGEHRG